MSEIDDIALQAIAQAVAESLTEDPEKRLLVESGLMMFWKGHEQPAPSEPPPKRSRPKTVKIHPVAKPESWDKAEAYLVLDYHYLAYHASHKDFASWVYDGFGADHPRYEQAILAARSMGPVGIIAAFRSTPLWLDKGPQQNLPSLQEVEPRLMGFFQAFLDWKSDEDRDSDEEPGETDPGVLEVLNFDEKYQEAGVWKPGEVLELWFTEGIRIYELRGQAAIDFWNWFTDDAPLPVFPEDPGEPDQNPVCNGVEPQDVK